jgi:hypothetical protein
MSAVCPLIVPPTVALPEMLAFPVIFAAAAFTVPVLLRLFPPMSIEVFIRFTSGCPATEFR